MVESENKWIPVKDPEKELPKDRVIWATLDYGDLVMVDIIYYSDSAGKWNRPIDKVIAYQEWLPTPYMKKIYNKEDL